MREFLEDAAEHMQDGYGRAQKHAQIELRKRFYQDAGVAERDGLFEVQLDGRPVRTPGRAVVAVGSAKLAEILADEWRVQEEFIDPRIMPHVRLVNAAVEAGQKVSVALREQVIDYAGNDLMLFRADSPQELVAEQDKYWDRVLGLLAQRFDIRFEPMVGIIHKPQPEATLSRLAGEIETLDHVALTALMSITNLTGSGLLGIALYKRMIDGDEAWTAAHVDEDFNNRIWGEDFEAAERRRKRRLEFDAAVTVLDLLG